MAQIDDSPGRLDITFLQGDGRVYDFKFYDLDTDEEIDVSPDAFTLTLLEPDGTVFDTYTLGDGLEVVTPEGSTLPNGVRFTISAALSDTMTTGPYQYKMRWTPDGAEGFTPFMGCISVISKAPFV